MFSVALLYAHVTTVNILVYCPFDNFFGHASTHNVLTHVSVKLHVRKCSNFIVNMCNDNDEYKLINAVNIHCSLVTLC